MNLSIKEQNAINWLIDYTKEYLDQVINYSSNIGQFKK